MRTLSALLWLLCAAPALAEPPAKPLAFQQASQLWLTTTPARLYSDNVVYVQTHLPGGCVGWCNEGTWQTVDLTPYGVASDAKWAFLSGMLIVTHGSAIEIADLKVVFRRPGDTSTDCTKYLGQAIEAHVGGGQRSNISTWVPLSYGVFEWCYTTTTPGNWPDNSAYAVNISLQAWAK